MFVGENTRRNYRRTQWLSLIPYPERTKSSCDSRSLLYEHAPYSLASPSFLLQMFTVRIEQPNNPVQSDRNNRRRIVRRGRSG